MSSSMDFIIAQAKKRGFKGIVIRGGRTIGSYGKDTLHVVEQKIFDGGQGAYQTKQTDYNENGQPTQITTETRTPVRETTSQQIIQGQ